MADPTVAADAVERSSSRDVNLRSEAREIFRYSSPRLIAIAFALALVVRVGLGAWTVADLAVGAAILAFEPFTEWLIHVFVLHAKPRSVLGRRIDLLAARRAPRPPP